MISLRLGLPADAIEFVITDAVCHLNEVDCARSVIQEIGNGTELIVLVADHDGFSKSQYIVDRHDYKPRDKWNAIQNKVVAKKSFLVSILPQCTTRISS